MAEIVYVDEESAQANQVVRSAVASKQFTEDQVVSVIPEPTLDETVDLILTYRCKALIVDYRLSEHKADVEFNGVDLVREYQRRFDAFPCFVATSFAGQAIKERIDANIIFPKSDFLKARGNDESLNSELPFFMRVRRKIDEYESFVENSVSEFNELAATSEARELTVKEVERLIELDGVVERLGGKSTALPEHVKNESLATFGDLIEKAEALIARIKEEIGEEG